MRERGEKDARTEEEASKIENRLMEGNGRVKHGRRDAED